MLHAIVKRFTFSLQFNDALFSMKVASDTILIALVQGCFLYAVYIIVGLRLYRANMAAYVGMGRKLGQLESWQIYRTADVRDGKHIGVSLQEAS